MIEQPAAELLVGKSESAEGGDGFPYHLGLRIGEQRTEGFDDPGAQFGVGGVVDAIGETGSAVKTGTELSQRTHGTAPDLGILGAKERQDLRTGRCARQTDRADV